MRERGSVCERGRGKRTGKAAVDNRKPLVVPPSGGEEQPVSPAAPSGGVGEQQVLLACLQLPVISPSSFSLLKFFHSSAMMSSSSVSLFVV